MTLLGAVPKGAAGRLVRGGADEQGSLMLPDGMPTSGTVLGGDEDRKIDRWQMVAGFEGGFNV